ncbi:MAG: pyridoxal kinase [Hyphomicrobiales bacterium]|nr:pyridoxal kinase [Hyphomicrobiales bacterium]
MAAVLLFSSQVAHGHVGNSAMQFALQRLGVNCAAVPSIFLSNRPDYAAVHHTQTAVETCDGVLSALEANGWMNDLRAIITGYLPSEAHVALAARWIERLRAANPAVLYICDPVIGDEPDGVYLDEAAARAVRDQLIPLAQIATPNRFELSWLTGLSANTSGETVNAARALGLNTVLVTSSPAENETRLANTLVLPAEAWMATVARRESVPHGTGDFLAAVFTARLLQGYRAEEALALATASMDALVSASAGLTELEMAASQSVWADPMPWPIHELFSTPHAPVLMTA